MSRTVALAAVTFALTAAPAAADDYAAVARNIIPSGQYGSVPPPPGADEQALMYDALTPLFDNVTNDDVMTKFKSAGFGVGPDGPGRPEAVPRAGVTIVRDRFNVPHITGATRDDVTWAMGWVMQQDRGLLLAQVRNAAKLAALDAPNVYAFGLIINLRQYTPTKAVDRMIEREGLKALRAAGAPGTALLHDIDLYIQGLNARQKAEGSSAPPWRRADVFAANAVVGEIFGEGGGDEARRSTFLAQLRKRYGSKRGDRMFDDFTSFNDPDSPASMSKSFKYGTKNLGGRGSVVLDAGSYKPTGPKGLAIASAMPRFASNFLLVSGRRSATGHPLFVGGPQIGYTYPGLTLEADLSWPGGQARGATTPGFAGSLVIGRGQDYAWTLTSANSDVVDTYVETLCGGSRTKYRYKGRCRTMGRVQAGAVKDFGKIDYRTTVHGPVVAYAKVKGRTVAVSRKRSSFGQDVLWQLAFRDLTSGKVRDATSFRAALASSPFTFNVGYADDKDIAMYSAGKLPVRPRSADPRLPVKGTGEYEWRGFLPQSRRPFQVNPPSGVLVNWNNRPAPGWGSADDNWSYGSAQRVQMLEAGLAKRGVHDLASVTGAMNAAATQDLRSVALTPILAKLLRAHPAGATPRAVRMLDLLEAWHAAGSSRLDREPDGIMDAGPAPAIWDAFYPKLWAIAMPVEGVSDFVGTNSGPASGFTGGGFWYLHKDLGRLTGTKWRDPLNERYCGNGNAAECAAEIWAALNAVPGDPDALRANANAERIAFRPGLLPTTIRYTNRPSGIQQVMSFGGRRP